MSEFEGQLPEISDDELLHVSDGGVGNRVLGLFFLLLGSGLAVVAIVLFSSGSNMAAIFPLPAVGVLVLGSVFYMWDSGVSIDPAQGQIVQWRRFGPHR